MAEAVREPALIQRRPGTHQSSYRQTAYRRSILHRLTAFSWFAIALASLALIAITGLILTRVTSTQQRSVMLQPRLEELHKAAPTPLPIPLSTPVLLNQQPSTGKNTNKLALVKSTPTALPSPTSSPTPAPTPTANPNDAPWARQLVQQPDGSLLAPKIVIDQAIADLSEYYTLQRDLPPDQYVRQRFSLLETYFSGPALAQMRADENTKKEYTHNRAGTFYIDVRDFSPDGMKAVAGVTKHGWVNDVYDITTMKLTKENVAEPDSLTLLAITFDRGSNKWKISAIEAVREEKQ